MSNCFSVEIKKSAEKVDDEKEIIELVKKEREKEIELIRVKKPIVKPILFPYKKVVKVYEKPIGKSVKDEWNDCSFFFFFRNFRFDRSIDRSNRLNGGEPRSSCIANVTRFRELLEVIREPSR